MAFTKNDLVNYLSSGQYIVSNEAMNQLNELLFKELREFCATCEDDRMICVLSPMCPTRILLKVRLQSGALLDDIPRFCYSQCCQNINRFFAKRTTLYIPKDQLIFNKDFIEMMFPRQYKNFMKYYNTDLPKLHEIIDKSKIPAVNLDFRNADREMFKKIIQKDKVIREGTFIYDISGEFLIVWYEGITSISNFTTDITIVNAKEDFIQKLKLIDLVFHIYCAENDILGFTYLKGENQMTFLMKIPFDQVNSEWFNPKETYFQRIFDKLGENFFEIKLSTDEQTQLTISMQYRNLPYFLERNKLAPITYNVLHDITKLIGELRESPVVKEE